MSAEPKLVIQQGEIRLISTRSAKFLIEINVGQDALGGDRWEHLVHEEAPDDGDEVAIRALFDLLHHFVNVVEMEEPKLVIQHGEIRLISTRSAKFLIEINVGQDALGGDRWEHLVHEEAPDDGDEVAIRALFDLLHHFVNVVEMENAKLLKRDDREAPF